MSTTVDSNNTTSGYQKKTKLVWKCTVCGYVETAYPEGLPDDYRCPICNAKPKKFVQVEIEV